jgi:hypothetical protein
VNVAALSQGIAALCQRLQPTLDQWTFAPRRQLVAWLIDRVIVNDTQVEIRYVVPTGPTGETTPFCHLRLDYLHLPAPFIGAIDHIERIALRREVGQQVAALLRPAMPTDEQTQAEGMLLYLP